ncbi:MAG: hypothetical protein A2166_03525 [Omnitrophica WOR_2 bacterium RBG_13_41_10]|nr:MAG: hypothetical protein A2166_03525 [Omnitrophica WOR_2 bacterium RBG_13_41_10]
MPKHNKGFTVLEIIITLVVIGILATLAINNYSSMREKILDNEAKANLKLIRAAEKSYYLDVGTYYPVSDGDVVSDIALINQNLKVFLPAGSNQSWNYEVFSNDCYMAVRNGGDGRIWLFSSVSPEPQACPAGSCDCIE